MNIILITGILLIIVSLTTRKKYKPYVGFAFVLLIMGFQSGVEGDFMGYMQEYQFMETSSGIDARTVDDEPLMPYLMKIFSSFAPFELFVFFLSLFEVVVLYKFVQKYAPNRYYWISAILFFFSFNMMLMQMKAMRQGLAIEITLLSFMMIDRSKNFVALMLACLAYLTHNSMLVVLPFLVLFYFAKKKPTLLDLNYFLRRGLFFLPTLMVIVYLAIYVVKIRFLNQYLVPLILLTGGEGNRLASYAEGNNTVESLDNNLFDISPLIVLYDAIIVFLACWYYRFADVKMRFFSLLTVVAAFGDMLFFGAGSFSRMIMYFVVYNLAVYPSIVCEIRKRFGPLWAFVFIVMLIGYAVKTSLPWMLGVDDGRFGTYRFVFMP